MGRSSVFIIVSILAVNSPLTPAWAQDDVGAVDYSDLIEERRRQQEAEQWRPLLEAVLAEVEETAPAVTAADRHASVSAVSIANEPQAPGRLMFVPQGSEFEQAISAHVAAQCSRPPTTERQLDEASAAIQQGASVGFSLSQPQSRCQGSSISLVSERRQDQRDFELRLSPELSSCASGACQVRGVKGEVRLGEMDGENDDGKGWYVFAGADGTLVVWDERPTGFSNLQDVVDVRDTFAMGDIEAGIMLNRGAADLSLSYVHRETRYRTWNDRFEDNEDYFGLKLTID